MCALNPVMQQIYDLTKMSIEDLKDLRVKVTDELKNMEDISSVTIEKYGTVFIVKADNIRAKDKEIEGVFQRYGPGELYYCMDGISFCFQDFRGADDCMNDIERVKKQMKNILYD